MLYRLPKHGCKPSSQITVQVLQPDPYACQRILHAFELKGDIPFVSGLSYDLEALPDRDDAMADDRAAQSVAGPGRKPASARVGFLAGFEMEILYVEMGRIRCHPRNRQGRIFIHAQE